MMFKECYVGVGTFNFDEMKFLANILSKKLCGCLLAKVKHLINLANTSLLHDHVKVKYEGKLRHER